MFIATAAIGGKSATAVLADHKSNSTNPNKTYTYAGTLLGAEADSRQLVALVTSQNSNLVSDLLGTTALTIGGQSGTKLYHLPAGNQIAEWSAWIWPSTANGGPTGASDTMVITRNVGNGFSYAHVALFAAYDLRSSALVDAQEGGGNPASINVTTRQFGILLAQAVSSGGAAHDWTGATSQIFYSGGVSGSQRISAALVSKTTSEAAHNVQVDVGAGISVHAATFR